MQCDAELGKRIANAVEEEEFAVAASLIQAGVFIVFEQIDPENEESAEDEEGNFSVVLAEVEDELAVVCFSDEEAAQNFASEVVEEDIPEGHELPAIVLNGESLLEGLPDECGLLVNPGVETECYFPPGALG
ncbi:MAG: SseB family protein [Pirellulaceae bacterium]